MIKRLRINNYALIESIDIELDKGLSIITGETGAGKSILLGALALLSGERADNKIISDKTQKTIVEALFSNLPDDLKELMVKNDLDWNPDEMIVRRELSSSGRSRAFVNDTPVNLGIIAEIMSRLIDIHSQHENLFLAEPANRLRIIDEFSDSKIILEEYRELFANYLSLRSKIKKLKDRIEKNKAETEFVSFQLEQLEKLKPKEGELKQVEKLYELLSDADAIQESLGEACNLIDGNEFSILSNISALSGIISRLNSSVFENEAESEDLVSRLKDIRIELKDISDTIRSRYDGMESDPQKLEKVSSRMSQLYDAIRRFKVNDEKGLVDYYKSLKEKSASLDTDPDMLHDLEKEAKGLAIVLKEKADKLSDIRKSGAEKLGALIQEQARPLGLPNIKFEVEVKSTKLTPDGKDFISFRCSFNKNHALQDIEKIASGGELSRVVLALKAIMAGNTGMSTMIFDEIDTGVSGEIADKMGNMMRDIAHDFQVITITHLPQVASKGKTHFKVYKTDDEEKTKSHIKLLEGQDRVKEIAGMLSGEKINDSALSNAEFLLKNSNNP